MVARAPPEPVTRLPDWGPRHCARDAIAHGTFASAGQGTQVLVGSRWPESLLWGHRDLDLPGACLRESRSLAMTDNVLQSFCERCGARFTQPAPAEKPPPPAGVLGLFRRRTAEPASAPDDAAALTISEAFRDTFHFCMGCRRYNCPDCWNEQQGECLSCRPHADPVAATTPGSDALVPGRVRSPDPVPKVQPADTTGAWPAGDSGRAEPVGEQPTSPWGPVRAPAGAESSAHQAAERPSASGAPAHGASPVDAADGSAVSSTANATDLPWTPAPELDPWRGVVFSSDDRGRIEPPVAPAWEAPSAPPAPPSVPIAAEEVGVLASLIDSEAHVDAADWARASSAVVGSGTLKAGRPDEPETVAEEVAAAAVLLPDEPETVAEEVAAAAVLLPDEPETVAEEVAAAAVLLPDEPETVAEEVAAAAVLLPDEPETVAEEVAAAAVLLPDEPETVAEEVAAAAVLLPDEPETVAEEVAAAAVLLPDEPETVAEEVAAAPSCCPTSPRPWPRRSPPPPSCCPTSPRPWPRRSPPPPRWRPRRHPLSWVERTRHRSHRCQRPRPGWTSRGVGSIRCLTRGRLPPRLRRARPPTG